MSKLLTWATIIVVALGAHAGGSDPLVRTVVVEGDHVVGLALDVAAQRCFVLSSVAQKANLYGQLSVLDWERGDPAGLPAQDLFFFLAHAALVGVRHRRERTLHAAFFGSQPWAWEMAERYARCLAFDTELLSPLLAVCCARALERVGTERMMPLWRWLLEGAA